MTGGAATGRVLALSGGVGGAKLAVGLARVVGAERLTVVCNTGDDFEHLGLHISPDLDSVMYALADKSDAERGWGRADEGWRFMEALGELGGEDWFRLGDRDLATHVERSRRLGMGEALTEITEELCRALGILPRVAPMTNDPVRTVVVTESGELAFQHYFVRDRCVPAVRGFRFDGIATARPSAPFSEALDDPALTAIIICPSNPFVSVDPIFALPGIEQRLGGRRAPIVAVSPIVGGQALKGPAAKMMAELGMPQTALEVARYYAGRRLLDGLVIDHLDAGLETAIRDLGVAVLVTQTVMTSVEDKTTLATECLVFAAGLETTP